MGLLPPASSSRSTIWRHFYSGTVLAATILLCTWGGVLVDRHWSSSPWGVLVGAILGFVAGFYNFIREFIHNDNQPSKGT